MGKLDQLKLAEAVAEVKRYKRQVSDLEKTARDLRVEIARLQGEILFLKAQVLTKARLIKPW